MSMPRPIISLASPPSLHFPSSRRRGFYNYIAPLCSIHLSLLVLFHGIVSTCADPATTDRVEPVLLPRQSAGDVALLVYRRMLGDEEAAAAGIMKKNGEGGGVEVYEEGGRRALVGSSPPKCIKKCGTCEPCKSVLVPIHSNSVVTISNAPTQYYPEAWRCQCNGKLYNP